MSKTAATLPGQVPAATAHRDTFAHDHLPPRELWPEMRCDGPSGPGDYPARLNCAAELLDRRVSAGDGDRTAILSDGGRWSYRELLERAERIAAVLQHDFGLIPGERVLLRGPNHPMMAAAWFGVLRAGGVVVATMPLLRTRELAYVVEKARVRIALTDARLAAELDEVALASSIQERVVRFNDAGAESLEARMERHPRGSSVVDTAADDVALIAFTSGTTGEAKGTAHVHRDVLAICDCFPPHVLRPSPDDVFCGSPPLAFTFGLGGILLFPLRIGAASLLVEQPTPPNLLQAIQDHRATICFTAPTAYRVMAGMVEEYDIASLRKCVSAGETLPLATFEAWRAATGIQIIDGIGSTEMLHIFISSPTEEIRPGATGRVVPGYEARVVDPAGNPLPAGKVGRLAVRGPTGCRYLDDDERQRAYVQDGWNLTGDSYRMDADGYFWYQARNDDMIVSAGYNIAGPEVENVLLEHPAVLECAVVGVPDEERGQVVKAFVVPREGHTSGDGLAKALQDHVKAQIAPYKYPRRVEFVETLPRTATGKLQRFRLREGTG
ncbi:MAG: benzoate-CoA ligase family protein [Gemmatimonadota bacterium]|nr:benzoate-CoA ligase family protein [Gemmatimonadota bacterium]